MLTLLEERAQRERANQLREREREGEREERTEESGGDMYKLIVGNRRNT